MFDSPIGRLLRSSTVYGLARARSVLAAELPGRDRVAIPKIQETTALQ